MSLIWGKNLLILKVSNLEATKDVLKEQIQIMCKLWNTFLKICSF